MSKEVGEIKISVEAMRPNFGQAFPLHEAECCPEPEQDVAAPSPPKTRSSLWEDPPQPLRVKWLWEPSERDDAQDTSGRRGSNSRQPAWKAEVRENTARLF